MVNACVQAAEHLGLPEAYLPLTEAAIYLATLPKSNSVTAAYYMADEDYKAGKGKGFPRAMQNVHYDSAEVADKGQNYLYPHNYENHWIEQQYIPDDLVGAQYYMPGDNRTEQAAKSYWDKIKNK